MGPHERYRRMLLRAELPPLPAQRRRHRLIASLRLDAELPVWRAEHHLRADLPGLIDEARRLGPSWTR